MWAREVPGAVAGHQYQFEIANGDRHFRKNDAYARAIHEKTALSVIYADIYEWKTSNFSLPNWNELIIYELHVGTFAPGPEGPSGGIRTNHWTPSLFEEPRRECARNHAADGFSGRTLVGL